MWLMHQHHFKTSASDLFFQYGTIFLSAWRGENATATATVEIYLSFILLDFFHLFATSQRPVFNLAE